MVAQEAEKHDSGIDFGVRKERSPWGDAWRQLIKNKIALMSGVFLVALVLMAVFANLIAPYHYAEGNLSANYAMPGSEYWLGADFLGRDMLSRTIYGAQVSLAVGFVGAFVSMVIGMVYGLISGYSSNRMDNLMMRVVDFLYAMPILIFVILLQVYFKAVSRQGTGGPVMQTLVEIDTSMGGMFFIFIAIGMLNWLQMARIMRGQVLSIKQKEFVEAARSIGSSDGRIIFKHLLPNALGPCIVAETLAIPGYISLEAFLSFLGLGVNAPRPSWGMMISEGYKGLRSYPHLLLAPAVALTLTILAFNFLGDGLRDAFDPRLRGQ